MQHSNVVRGRFLLAAIAINIAAALLQWAVPSRPLSPHWAGIANSVGITLLLLSQYPSSRLQMVRIPLLIAGIALMVPLILAVTGQYPA